MRQPHIPLRFISLVLAGAALAACDQRTPDLPTGARAEAAQAWLAPLMTAAEAVPGRYVVVMQDGQPGAGAAAVARDVVAGTAERCTTPTPPRSTALRPACRPRRWTLCGATRR